MNITSHKALLDEVEPQLVKLVSELAEISKDFNDEQLAQCCLHGSNRTPGIEELIVAFAAALRILIKQTKK